MEVEYVVVSSMKTLLGGRDLDECWHRLGSEQ